MPGKRRGCFVLLTTVQSKGDIGWWMGGGFTRFLFPGPFFWGGEWGGGGGIFQVHAQDIYIYIYLSTEKAMRDYVFLWLCGVETKHELIKQAKTLKRKVSFPLIWCLSPFLSHHPEAFPSNHPIIHSPGQRPNPQPPSSPIPKSKSLASIPPLSFSSSFSSRSSPLKFLRCIFGNPCSFLACYDALRSIFFFLFCILWFAFLL